MVKFILRKLKNLINKMGYDIVRNNSYISKKEGYHYIEGDSYILKKEGYHYIEGNSYILKKEGYHYVENIYGDGFLRLIDIRTDKLFFGIANLVKDNQRTMLGYDRLFNIYQLLLDIINRNKSPFKVLEIGVYRGGTSYFIAKLFDKLNIKDVQMFSIDTFEGHSSKDVEVEGKHVPGKFSKTDYSDISQYLSEFKFVKVLKNRIQDVIDIFANEMIDFIHLDTDLYSPTIFSLNYFSNKIKKGGVIIVDDYYKSSCPGIIQAIDEFIAKDKSFVKYYTQVGQCVLIKV
jgi:O-methyltransferase